MHFQSSVPASLRGSPELYSYPELHTMGEKFAKFDAPKKLEIQNPRRLSFLNLFLSILSLFIIRFMGETIRLPTVWSDGKSLFPPGREK